MKPDLEPIDLAGVKTTSIEGRVRLVHTADFAAPWTAGGSLAVFLERLPGVLAAADLKTVMAAIAGAARRQKPVIFAMGAHVLKVGLGPVVIDLMQRGVITGVAMNGAGIIHDLELAMTGRTSEDVGPALEDGSFGMAAEPSAFLSRAVDRAHARGEGLGRAVGETIRTAGFAFESQQHLSRRGTARPARDRARGHRHRHHPHAPRVRRRQNRRGIPPRFPPAGRPGGRSSRAGSSSTPAPRSSCRRCF